MCTALEAAALCLSSERGLTIASSFLGPLRGGPSKCLPNRKLADPACSRTVALSFPSRQNVSVSDSRLRSPTGVLRKSEPCLSLSLL